MCFGCVRVSNVCVCVCMCAMYSFNLQNVSPCCTYNRQIQIPVKVSARYKLPHLRSGGSSHTHMYTHTDAGTTGGHACNSIFNGGQH